MDRKKYLTDAYNTLRYNGVVHTQQDFANILGINRSSLSRALNGDDKYLTNSLIEKVRALLDKGVSAAPLEAVATFTALDSDRDEQKTIPLLPIGARAGTLGDFADSVQDYDCERMISPIRGADYAIQVTGDSMSPAYPNGSQIIIKKISAEYIAWGNVFCLDTNDGAIIKQVFPTEDEGVIECRSINPAYPPFRVKRDLINGWYRVLMCLTLK